MAWVCPLCEATREDLETKCPCGYVRTQRPIDPAGNPVPDRPPPGPPPPVSEVCPSCGGVEYRKVRPHGTVAFVFDRICLACGTRYSPPTPGWAAGFFISAGSILVAVAVFSTFGRVMRGDPVPLPICEIAMAIPGTLAIAHGIRVLWRGY